MHPVPPELAATATSLGLRIDGVLRRTDKTLLAAGELAGEHVAVKLLLDTEPFWSAKWHHEVDVYRTFADSPPPIRTPRLLYTDNSRILVLEWVEGQQLDDDRYPQRALTTSEADAVLRGVSALHHWHAPKDRFKTVFDYPERFSRYHANGYLTGADHEALNRLLADVAAPDELNHGDPLASNILIRDDGEATLLDWEFTGLFLPGFDLAMLHTQLGVGTPMVKDRIDALIEESGFQAAFIVNLAAVLTRERRLHCELPEGPLRSARLPHIDVAWQHARDRLHTFAGRGT
ncbi:phosphotransferase family protein [Micromonosporaceae bacterium Da 78-11]